MNFMNGRRECGNDKKEIKWYESHIKYTKELIEKIKNTKVEE